jgi:signal transduction histidine kinase
MIPGIPLGRANILFVLIAIALIVMAILGIFKNSIYNRLSTRIIGLIFASSLVAIIISSVLDEPLYNTQHPFRWHLVQTALIVLGGPVVLGVLAARFVRRPLRQFNDAIASLEQSNYKVQLEPTGVREFDEVFSKFNNLTNRLQREERLRKDLVSDTSHELNTPLTVMIGQLTAVQEGKHAMTEERVSILKEQAERLAELVQQLDAYTKARTPDAGEAEDIHVKRFCKELVNHFELELKQKGITANLHIVEDYTIHANRGALQQILTNLIQNTLRYSGATELTIKATANSVTFSDNGKGVPHESLPYLFERFYRVDKSRNRTSGGLGLGLAIVRELVEGQGWTITAKAGHPGLTFVIKLDA